ncbi:MAG: hypothetical protein V4668_01315 [Patescibacteria group bacterium]
MLTKPPEIGFLTPRSRAQKIEAKKQRRTQCSEMKEISPFDLIGFHPWPEAEEESNVTL